MSQNISYRLRRSHETLAFALLSIDRGAAATLRATEILKANAHNCSPHWNMDILPSWRPPMRTLATSRRIIAVTASGTSSRSHAGDVSDLFPDQADKSITGRSA